MSTSTGQGSAPLARVVVDGREVEVPAGTGLVEAAAAAGVEIPVFCYEPRIGPAVGACRMCMVEIEGMPKLQTACSTPVRDGMVVSTVSDRSRDAQEAVLEFLLINHPLDCPVCDKGGECPLQDQTYRWGPGTSRFSETKRVNDKPIPISPLIALDRERCILCYRCTRFSSEVTGDLQLIARQRGTNSMIATFEGRPYADNFSGNVIELCPVGALTNTEYRFKARPWEAPDHPTVCGSCPVGCNIHATVREGEIQRIISRENVDVDNGWICDRGRFAYPSLRSPARITVPQERKYRDRPTGNTPSSPISFEGALEWLYRRLDEGRASKTSGATWVLGGTQTLEEVYAIQKIAAATGGRVVAAEGASAAGPASEVAASIADVLKATRIVIIGDADLAELAPILELRVRDAVKAGAHLMTAGIGGTRLEQLPGAIHSFVAPGGLDSFARELAADPDLSAGLRESRTVIITTDGELSGDTQSALSSSLGLTEPGSGILSVPTTSNSRGLAAMGVEPAGCDVLEDANGLVFVGVNPARIWPEARWRPAVRSANWALAVDLFWQPLHDAVDIVIPAVSTLEKDGTLVNLEGRLQRLTLGAAAPDEVKPELSWLAGLARRLAVPIPGWAAGAYRGMASRNTAMPVATHGEIPAEGILGVSGGPVPRPQLATSITTREGELSLYVAPNLYDADDVANTERMAFLREATPVVLNREDARSRGLRRGDDVQLTIDGSAFTARVDTSSRIQEGHARVPSGAPGVPRGAGTYHACMLARQTSVSLESGRAGS